jgi:hypothetical protein
MNQSEKPGAADALKRALDAYLGAVEAQYGMELCRLTIEAQKLTTTL